MAVTASKTAPKAGSASNGRSNGSAASKGATASTPKGYQTAAHLTAVGPYKLHAGPHLLSDWRFVEAGTPTYVDRDGQTIHYTDPPNGRNTEQRPVWFRGVHIPSGIRIIAEPAVKSDPVEGPMGATVLYDGGRYRSWDGAEYSESEDGFRWTRPVIPGETPGGIGGDQQLWHGQSAELAGRRNERFFDKVGVHGPGVFIDPSAPPSERYKMIFWSALGRKDRRAYREKLYADYVQRRPHDVDPLISVRGGIDLVGGTDALMGATSPDGLQWTLVEEPFVVHMADNPNTMYYDTLLKKYVLFTRVNWMFGRRAIGRSESDTFGPFPQPEMVVFPDLEREPSDDLYTNAKCLYPGTVDQHFLFPTVYSHAKDNGKIDVYSSPDSIHWFRVPGGPVITGDPATHDGGWLATHCGLVPLPGDRVGVPYRGSTFPHKYPRWPDRGDQGVPRYALWQKERLACVEAKDDGQFATPPLQVTGRQLRLNLKTPLSGEVRVEVAAITDWEGKKKYAFTEQVAPGRSFEDCDPISGDRLSHTVTWRGQSDLALPEGAAVRFRFRLRAAKLYAFEVLA
jgi:hypothetical protein